MTPHVARCTEAVQHDDRWTMAADPHMDGCTVGFDRPRLHHSREGINPIYVDMLAHLCIPGLLLVGASGVRPVSSRRRCFRVSLANRDTPGGSPRQGAAPSRAPSP